METIAGNLPVSSEENDSRHDLVQNEDGSWTAVESLDNKNQLKVVVIVFLLQ